MQIRDVIPVTEFFLSTEIPMILHAASTVPAERWMQIPHSCSVSPAYVLLAGDSLEIPHQLRPTCDSRLVLRYGAAHENLSTDGATLSLLIASDGNTHQLVKLSIPAGRVGLIPREVCVDLSAYAGLSCTLCLQAGRGREPDSIGDWLAIYEYAIGDAENLPSIRARAFRSERSANELAHFAAVYDHQIYQHGSAPTEIASGDAKSASVHSLTSFIERSTIAPQVISAIVRSPTFPAPEELPAQLRDPYHYTHHLLSTQLRSTAPEFVGRLKEMGAQRPLRVLSLCSGTARIEASLAASAGIRAHWTLMDLSEPLLRSAAVGFPDGTAVELIVGDLNLIRDFGQRFDIILCVSGLHHIVELENVISFIQAALSENGEFWSIGEAIGRNGNRLWRNDYAVANAFFRSLPERLRYNRTTAVADKDLPNIDCSSATFEGIRSQDIEPLIARYLEPVDIYRRNCFLWRLVDLAYAENYDMALAEDVLWLQRAVALELTHFRTGGRPTELHGVFRRRTA